MASLEKGRKLLTLKSSLPPFSFLVVTGDRDAEPILNSYPSLTSRLHATRPKSTSNWK